MSPADRETAITLMHVCSGYCRGPILRQGHCVCWLRIMRGYGRTDGWMADGRTDG